MKPLFVPLSILPVTTCATPACTLNFSHNRRTFSYPIDQLDVLRLGTHAVLLLEGLHSTALQSAYSHQLKFSDSQGAVMKTRLCVLLGLLLFSASLLAQTFRG